MAVEGEKVEKTTDDFIKDLDSKFQARLAEQESKISAKLLAMNKESSAAVTESDTNDDEASDDDDEFITKKDLKKLLQKSQPDIERIFEQKLKAHSTSASRDAQAYRDFPELNRESPFYNPEFEAATKEQMEQRNARGRAVNDPDLVYDAAAVVRATNPKFYQRRDDQVTEQYRQQNNRDGSFQVRSGNSKDTKSPNEYQRELANRFGLNHKDLENHFKNRM